MTNEEATYGWSKSFQYVSKRQNGVLFLFALFLFSSCCKIGSCEITITTQSAKIVTGVKVVNGQVQVDDSGKVSIASVLYVSVVTPAKFVDVTAKRFTIVGGVVQIDDADVSTVANQNRLWLLTGKGDYKLEVVTFDPVAGIERKKVDVTIADAEPVPDTTVLAGLAKDSRDALRAMVASMANDMASLSSEVAGAKYKTVIEASAASNAYDTATRNAFKQAMGKSMQPLLGSGPITPESAKVFSDIATGFRGVK